MLINQHKLENSINQNELAIKRINYQRLEKVDLIKLSDKSIIISTKNEQGRAISNYQCKNHVNAINC